MDEAGFLGMQEEQQLTIPMCDYLPVLARMLNACIASPELHLGLFVLRSAGRARLDFYQNLQYKFIELLSVAFVESDEETVRRSITHRCRPALRRARLDPRAPDGASALPLGRGGVAVWRVRARRALEAWLAAAINAATSVPRCILLPSAGAGIAPRPPPPPPLPCQVSEAQVALGHHAGASRPSHPHPASGASRLEVAMSPQCPDPAAARTHKRSLRLPTAVLHLGAALGLHGRGQGQEPVSGAADAQGGRAVLARQRLRAVHRQVSPTARRPRARWSEARVELVRNDG